MMTFPRLKTVCGTAAPADLAGGRLWRWRSESTSGNRSFRLTLSNSDGKQVGAH